ncbi:hypothetical protein ABIB90_003634 [Bradyrhizobium sp. JR4.1]|uniref:hypothetical protein n=1 Tax=Bradyrhizobium sp. JR4.1 TaxID=3156372 RepID=UPI0033916B67
MPKRVNPKWGWTGMVRLEGYASPDDALGELDSHSEPAGDQRQALHRPLAGAQCDDLIKDLDLPLLDGHRTECHDWLNWIREDALRECLRRSQQPTRAEIHEALDQTGQLLRHFVDASEQRHADWIVQESPILAPGPLTVFWLFPRRLRTLADYAKKKARHADIAELVVLANAADRLADVLMLLDWASSDKISRELPEAYDYEVRHLVDAVRIAQRLEHATRTALETSKKRGGPLPQPTMVQVVIWLAELVERYGGTFTHNPYVGTAYDGSPQTPAGLFVLNFMWTCKPPLSASPQTVSNWMAAAIKWRNRARAPNSEIRERSF